MRLRRSDARQNRESPSGRNERERGAFAQSLKSELGTLGDDGLLE